eukprot:SAG11_NODE_1298_length_5265_cov_3.096787_9_plen_57_part_00
MLPRTDGTVRRAPVERDELSCPALSVEFPSVPIAMHNASGVVPLKLAAPRGQPSHW